MSEANFLLLLGAYALKKLTNTITIDCFEIFHYTAKYVRLM